MPNARKMIEERRYQEERRCRGAVMAHTGSLDFADICMWIFSNLLDCCDEKVDIAEDQFGALCVRVNEMARQYLRRSLLREGTPLPWSQEREMVNEIAHAFGLGAS